MALKHQGECNVDCLANDQCVDDMMVDDVKSPECNINCLVYDPVCGVDGVTYGCGTEDASCHGVEVDYAGECKVLVDDSSDGIFEDVLMYTSESPVIDEEKGFAVTEKSIKTSQIDLLMSSGNQIGSSTRITIEDGFITMDEIDFTVTEITDKIGLVTH